MIIAILFCVCYLAAWAAVMRYHIQMFQQNSYMPQRYFRWLKGSFYTHGAILPVLALALCWTPFLRLLGALLFAYIAYREFSTSYKIKIAYTKRVIRLIITTILLSVLLIFLAGKLFNGVGMVAFVAVLLLVLAPFIVVLANLINSPIESAIRRWYYNDAAKMLAARPDLTIIGITGSFGKTSTKNYLYRILSEKYNTLVTPGNFNTTLGVVRTVREQLKPYHKIFIVEMGAKQRGDIKEICDLVHPSIGIVTSVGDMHLETFGSRENILATKFELLDALPANGFGVVNFDSEPIASARIPDNCGVLRYGIRNSADIMASDLEYSASGTSFTLSGLDPIPFRLSTRLLGESNVLNIVAAATVAFKLGMSADQIRIAVSKLQQVEHRLSMSNKGGLVVLDDAYNSNPLGAKMALDVMQGIKVPQDGKHVVITPGFVEMGSAQFEANKELGSYAAGKADLLVIVNKLNREAILQGAREAGMDEGKIVVADSLSEALQKISGSIKPGDVLLYENDLPDMFK